MSLAIERRNDQLVVDSRVIAQELGIEHRAFKQLCQDLWEKEVTTLSVFDILSLKLWAYYGDVPFNCFPLLNKLEKHLDHQAQLTYAVLKTAVISEIANIERNKEFKNIHTWFNTNYQHAIPNGTLVKVISRDRKRPDFVVVIENVEYPVECKINFNAAGLKQLKNYMRLWKVNKGYAVAQKLSCSLPDNIIFIKCETSKNA